MSDLEKTSTEALLATQERLLGGLEIIAQHMEGGTFKTAAKEGAAPPAQAGWLTLIFLLIVEDELESRILGFPRTLDPKLIKI